MRIILIGIPKNLYFMKNMHKNTSVEEDPSFLFNSGGKCEILKDFYQSDNELNNHSSSEQKIIELSNNNSLIEQEKIKLDNDILNNISYISEKTDDFIDDSSLKEYFINYKIVTFDEILKKCNYLITSFSFLNITFVVSLQQKFKNF